MSLSILWFWIALGDRTEPKHQSATDLIRDLRRGAVPIVTSTFVLDEVATLLVRRIAFDLAIGFVDGILAASNRGELSMIEVTRDRFETAWALRKRYHDKPKISFTDLTTMVIMIEFGLTEILSDDDHFLHVGLGISNRP